jgi:hypothetical protein
MVFHGELSSDDLHRFHGYLSARTKLTTALSSLPTVTFFSHVRGELRHFLYAGLSFDQSSQHQPSRYSKHVGGRRIRIQS